MEKCFAVNEVSKQKGPFMGPLAIGNAKECAAKNITKQHCALAWQVELGEERW